MVSIVNVIFLLSIIIFYSTFINAQLTTYQCDRNASCGCSSTPVSVSLTKIYGGELAPNQSLSWTVLVFMNGTNFCGGVLISSSWVLSSAKCISVYTASEIAVFAGTNLFGGFAQVRGVTLKINHPNYIEMNLASNVVLLRLSSPFDMNDPKISIICLPLPTTKEFPPTDSSLIAAGWGVISPSVGISRSLRQIALKRIADNSAECSSTSTHIASQFCAAGTNWNRTICAGDPGGPIVMYTSSQRWVLTGIISFSPSCGSSNQPSIHTKIVSILPWLQSMNVTGSFSIDAISNPNTTSMSSTTTVLTSTTLTSSTTSPSKSTTTSTITATFTSVSTTSKTSGCQCLLAMTPILFLSAFLTSLA